VSFSASADYECLSNTGLCLLMKLLTGVHNSVHDFTLQTLKVADQSGQSIIKSILARGFCSTGM